MKIKTYIIGKPLGIRYVDIPEDEILQEGLKNLNVWEILNLVFIFGQNKNQPKNIPSLSVGDLIVWDKSVYSIDSVGYTNVVTGEKVKDDKIFQR